jgi:hypothetical protein
MMATYGQKIHMYSGEFGCLVIKLHYDGHMFVQIRYDVFPLCFYYLVTVIQAESMPIYH